MNLSEISIRKPVFAWMLMAALIIFGWISFKRMGVSLLPDVDFPVVNISATLDGAAPEVIELNVVDPIEDAVMSVQGIKSVSSSSKTGSANITVEFELDKNIDLAVQEVQNAISRVQKRLPREMDPPSIQKTNPEDQPIIWLAVTSTSMNDRDLMTYVRDNLKDRFTTVPGVAEVFLAGYVDPNLRVWVSGKKLAQYSLTVQDVVGAVALEHSELPSGRIETKDREYNIRTMGEALTVQDFSALMINRRGGAPNFRPMSLSAVSTIEDGLADVRRRSRSGGKPAVGLGIRKQRGSNAVDVATIVKARMAEVKKSLPPGIEIGVRNDSSRFIKESAEEMVFTLVLSAVLTALVMWLFLGSLSATTNVVMAIPTSVIGAFIVLNALGFTVNTFTILGLSLAIGIVVDDAIMVLENIVRHKEMGKTRLKAALEGTAEISFAAMAATIAIIAIFLPVAFMKGIIGKFLFQFGVTLSVAVALSLLEALTLTPMRSAQYLEVAERTTRLGRGVENAFRQSSVWYRRMLEKALNYPWWVVAGSLIFFVASLGVNSLLKKEFVPPQDQSMFLIRLQAPVGSSLDYTDRKFAQVEKIVMARSEVDQYFGAIGGFGGGDVDTAMMFVTLKPLDKRGVAKGHRKPMSQQDLAIDLREELKQVTETKVFIQDLSLSGFSAKRGYPVEFTVRGPNWDTLAESSQILMKKMAESGQLIDIDSDYRTGMPEIQVFPDRLKAQSRGVSVVDIDQTINALIGGTIAGKFTKNGRRFDIRVRLVPEERNRIEDINNLKVRNNRGELIPVSEVVRVQEKKSLQAISRQDRERAITVYANLAPKVSQSKALEQVMEQAKQILPAGYHVVASGSAQTFKESFDSLMFALMLGLLVSYMVLASQFNSFVHPLTVLTALPFSISGAFIALWMGGQSLNIYSMIGLVLLMGIVKKNSILLVEFTQHKREEGLGVREALLEACPVRLRPILMTSLATIVGAIPAALALGPGAESRVPMALAVVGGVIVSTLLTLFVVPCVFQLFSKFQRQNSA